MRCSHDGCGWQTIAASAAGARRQYAKHLVEAHTEQVDAEVPEGKVQVRVGDEWETMTVEQARSYHDRIGTDD
jgi:predicted small metal-binding protein